MCRLEILTKFAKGCLFPLGISLSPAIAAGTVQAARGEKPETVLISAVIAEVAAGAAAVLGAIALARMASSPPDILR